MVLHWGLLCFPASQRLQLKSSVQTADKGTLRSE